VIGGDTSGTDEAIAEFERDTDAGPWVRRRFCG
jgi:hypothetical protein